MSNKVNMMLDVTKAGIQNPLVKLRQGDGNWEALRVTVTANGEPLELQGWAISFMGTTAGQHRIADTNVNIVEAQSGIFEYTPSKAWGMDVGEFKNAYFKFVKGDGSASTASFRVLVDKAVDITDEEAENYIAVFDVMIETATADLNNKFSSLRTNTDKAMADATTANANASAAVKAANDAVNTMNNSVKTVQVGGRNLVLGTSEKVVQAPNWDAEVANIKYDKSLGATLSASVMINNADHADILTRGSAQLILKAVNSNGNNLAISKGSAISYNANGLSQASISAPDGTAYIKASIFTINMLQNAYYSRLKIERGNIPTDWTPAPEDVPSNDAQLVHKTGTETIAGNKTFTGTTTFGSPVVGGLSSRWAPFTDFADVAKNMVKYAGNWYIWGADKPILNSPSAFNTYMTISVIPSINDTSGYIVVSWQNNNKSKLAVNVVNNSTSKGWEMISVDSEVVHNTGNETIGGNKILTGNTTILTGNYGLRVTSSGFQKTTDGGTTWVNATL